MAADTRTAILRAAERSPSIRVLLDHITALEQELDGTRYWIYEEYMVRGGQLACEPLKGIAKQYKDHVLTLIEETHNMRVPRMILIEGRWVAEGG